MTAYHNYVRNAYLLTYTHSYRKSAVIVKVVDIFILSARHGPNSHEQCS